MFRLAVLALTLTVSLASFSCQTYTSGLKKSLASADETAATGTLRTIAVAQQTYATSNNSEYGTFQQLCDGGYLDARFNSVNPAIKDYVLTMEVGKESEGPFFHCHADPSGASAQTGRHFYIDASAVLRVNPSAPATATDPPVQQ
jgi:hypothetical protein